MSTRHRRITERLLPGCKLVDCHTCECCWCDTHDQRSIFCAIDATQRGCAKIALDEAERLKEDPAWQVKMCGKACEQVGKQIGEMRLVADARREEI